MAYCPFGFQKADVEAGRTYKSLRSLAIKSFFGIQKASVCQKTIKGRSHMWNPLIWRHQDCREYGLHKANATFQKQLAIATTSTTLHQPSHTAL